jgi:hypothetical protein
VPVVTVRLSLPARAIDDDEDEQGAQQRQQHTATSSGDDLVHGRPRGRKRLRDPFVIAEVGTTAAPRPVQRSAIFRNALLLTGMLGSGNRRTRR